MATQDGERSERAPLKRKLTGPPRLLLGKTRTHRDAVETHKHADANTQEDALNAGSSRGRCEAADEDDDITNRKWRRRRWWRLSTAGICNRKQEEDADPADVARINTTKEDSEGKRRATVATWPMLKRFLTLFATRRAHEQRKRRDERGGSSQTLRKKLRWVFRRGTKSGSSVVAMETVEDVTECEEACSPAAQVDELIKFHGDESVEREQVVTVTAEMSQHQLVCDVTEEDVKDAGGPETILTEDTERPEDAAPEDAAPEDAAPEDATPEDVSSQEDKLSSSPLLAAQLHCDAQTDDVTSQSRHANGPSIRIKLVAPEDKDEEDDGEDGSSSENQRLLLLLLGSEHSERRLLQTARSLVRAALNAAVDQLSREQLSAADCVLREPPGCRDHA